METLSYGLSHTYTNGFDAGDIQDCLEFADEDNSLTPGSTKTGAARVAAPEAPCTAFNNAAVSDLGLDLDLGLNLDLKVSDLGLDLDLKVNDLGLDLDLKVSDLGLDLDLKVSDLGLDLDLKVSDLGLDLDLKVSDLGLDLDLKVSDLGLDLDLKVSDLDLDLDLKVSDLGLDLDLKVSDLGLDLDLKVSDLGLDLDLKVSDLGLDLDLKVSDLGLDLDLKVRDLEFDLDLKFRDLGLDLDLKHYKDEKKRLASGRKRMPYTRLTTGPHGAVLGDVTEEILPQREIAVVKHGAQGPPFMNLHLLTSSESPLFMESLICIKAELQRLWVEHTPDSGQVQPHEGKSIGAYCCCILGNTSSA
ncbi:hypothetical protein WMY93_023498 [Mugilogobius chulae]|uniref:Uncharacterized protein n=1 Tax=Mugilogobius chulae TaxID=88201 RepID=A0AAW0NEC4_9GOBI